MHRLLFRRWARALAILGAYLLALQSLGLPRFALAPLPCCCHERGEACHCPICAHVRARESGQPLVQTCDSSEAPVAIIALDPTLPTSDSQPPPRLAAETPRAQPPRTVQDPPQEVPTPPPLA